MLESLPFMVAEVYSNDNIMQLETTTQFRKLLSIEQGQTRAKLLQTPYTSGNFVFQRLLSTKDSGIRRVIMYRKLKNSHQMGLPESLFHKKVERGIFNVEGMGPDNMPMVDREDDPKVSSVTLELEVIDVKESYDGWSRIRWKVKLPA
ncbi:hypothetical protein Tco_1052407 [Tanacetum coccineum]